MRLDEISRRGFLKGVGAGAASTTMPGKEIAGIVKSLTAEVGGASNLKILAQLIGMFGVSRLDDFHEYNSGEYSFPEVLNDQEQKDLAEKILQLPDREGDPDIDPNDYQEVIMDYISNNDFDGDISTWASKLIGRETEYLQALDIISKNGVDEYDFFDYHDGVGEMIKNLSHTPGVADLGDAAKAAALPVKTIRLAGLISTIYNKVVGKKAVAAPQQEIPQQKAPVPELPAPSDDKVDFSNIDNLSRMQDLAGIKKNEPGSN